MVHRLSAALALALVVPACAAERTPRVSDVNFPPGQHVARQDRLRVELVSALYDEHGVSLRFALKNAGSAPVTVDRQGILLDHAGVEFPIASDPAPTIPVETEVPPKSEVHLQARFSFGHRLVEPATLRLRSIRRGDAWIEGVRLAIPPGFAPPPSDEKSEDRP